MAKPIIDVVTDYVQCTCGESFKIKVKVISFEEGDARVCFDIPSTVSVFFSETGSNSVCKLLTDIQPDNPIEMEIELKMDAVRKSIYPFFMNCSITDSTGHVGMDYFNVKMICE
jgi:hypothetical protein